MTWFFVSRKKQDRNAKETWKMNRRVPNLGQQSTDLSSCRERSGLVFVWLQQSCWKSACLPRKQSNLAGFNITCYAQIQWSGVFFFVFFLILKNAFFLFGWKTRSGEVRTTFTHHALHASVSRLSMMKAHRIHLFPSLSDLSGHRPFLYANFVRISNVSWQVPNLLKDIFFVYKQQ